MSLEELRKASLRRDKRIGTGDPPHRIGWYRYKLPPGQMRYGTCAGAHFKKPSSQIIHFSGPPVRTLVEMSREEIEALEQQYGCRVTGRTHE